MTAVNDAPSFSSGADETVLEDAGAQVVVAWATSISAGPADESGQTVSFNITNNTNPTLFSAGPAVASDGTLTYTPAADTFGSATLTLELMDNGGTANAGVDTSPSIMFDINVTSVNDPPTVNGETFDGVSFAAPIGNTTLEFSNAESVSTPHVYIGGDVLANDTDPDTATLSISTYDAASVQGGTVSMNTTTGEFTYQPPLGFEGADSFTYTVTDGTTPTVGTVNLTVSEMVWYLDNSAAAPGTGRSNAPFDTMASFNAVQGNGGATDPAAGDTIFLFETMITYQSGITLLDNQHLIGQGRDLVVNGTTLVTATTNPALTNASGDVVTLANDNIVEGLTLLPVASAGVAKILIIPEKAETTEKFGTETILRHLTINPDGGSNGIEFLAIPSGTLTVHNVTIQGLAGCTGSGILGDSSNVTLDFDDLSLQSPLGKGLDFFGMSGSLTATNVNISTDGLAVSIQGDNPNITFNGTSSITQNTGGGALDATLTGGTLNFGSIPISISNLDAFQNAVVLDAGGNDVVLAMSNLTIDASSGNDALVLTDLSASSMVSIGTTSLAITGAGNRGIVLTNNETTINFPVGSTISNTTGTAFEITGGAGTVTYPSALTNSAGRVVNIDGTTGGTITFLGTVTEQTGGLGVRVANSAGTITFADLNLGTSGSPLTSDAILLDTNTGIINLNDISVFTNLARGIVASGGSPTLNITTAIVNTTNALGLDLANAAMAANFANVSVNNGAGGGINLNNNTGTTTIGLLTIANTGGTGLNATNAGTVNVTDASSSIATANGPAIVVNPTTVGMAFANVSSTNSATTGISLTGLSGSLIMNSGSISGSTGTAFNVSGGNGTISYSGGITNTAGRLATIVNRTGGTITLSGALVDTGATGLLIQNNSSGGPAVIFSGTVDIANSTGTAITSQTNTGATISFADLDITNTTSNQTGLFVSSSGTFNSTTGIINTGSGRAVDIDNTNLGMILRSVSSNGGNNPGIDLNTTTGSFLVNGDGSNTSQGGNGTGGTIANKGGGDSTTAGIGVLLNNTVGVVLRRMQLNDHVNWAIYGTSVNGLGLEYLTINGTNGNNAGPDEGAIFLTNLTGSTSTTTFESIDVEGGLEDNIRIVNSTGSLDDFQLLNSRIGLNNNALGNDGVVVETSASATATLTVTGNTFVGARLDMFQLNTIGSGDIDLTFNNNVCANGHGNIVSGGGGITIGGGSASASGNFTFNITGNQISGALGNALFVGKDLGTAVFSGTISGNTIGIANNVSSGSTQASGIVVRAQDGGQVSSTISGNSIYGFNEYGIHCNARDGNGDMSVIVQGNTIEDNGTFALYGIQVLSGATASDTNELCATVGGAGALQNSITSDAFPIADIRIRQRFSTVMNIIGYAGGAADAAALQTYIQSQNAGTPTVSASIISIGGSCTF